MKLAAILILAAPAFAQYSAQKDGDVVRLQDAKRQTVVTVVTSRGNNAFDMRVKDKKVIQSSANTADEFKRGRGMSGIPFLAPWANRLEEMAYYANGKKYSLDSTVGNVRGPIPLHGFLMNATQWEVVEAKADANAAWVTSRLEFYRYPDWMKQWPFAHTIEMTYKLADGALEVHTVLHNLSTAPMPVAIGFHPYFQVNDAPRDEWTFSIGARTHWIQSRPALLPTGETEPIEKYLPGQPAGGSLKGVALDDLFADLVRDASGKATMWVQGKSEKVEVVFGPNYKAAVVYAPGPMQQFICFEPMAGVNNALNLAQKELYKELQYVAPGQKWQESFWIRPSGF